MRIIVFLLILMTELFPSCYSVKPSRFLRHYIHEFRKDYCVPDSDVIAMTTWSDSLHTYYKGVVVAGNEIHNKKDLIICRDPADNPLYKSKGEKLERRADRSIDYDDCMSFLLCFHNDNTICNLLSFEITPLYDIPVLSKLTKKFHLSVVEGPDPDSDWDGFITLDGPSPKRQISELCKELSDALHNAGISNNNNSIALLTISIDKTGHAELESLRCSIFDYKWEKRMFEIFSPIISREEFSPAFYRGVYVSSQEEITVVY